MAAIRTSVRAWCESEWTDPYGTSTCTTCRGLQGYFHIRICKPAKPRRTKVVDAIVFQCNTANTNSLSVWSNIVPTIRIDNEVYSWLQAQGRAFEDTPNSVLRRIGRLDDQVRAHEAERGTKTSQAVFRAPVIEILTSFGGEATRAKVLAALADTLSEVLTPFDLEEIESGGPRWQKSAEWEVRAMREAEILKPVNEAPRGYWSLSKEWKSKL